MESKSEPNTSPSSQLHSVELAKHFFIGALAGCTDAFLTHAFTTIKTRKQCNMSFTWNPRILYLGASASSVSMAPIVSTQMGFSSILLNYLHQHTSFSEAQQRCIAAFLAGVFSACIQVPTELINVQQQNTKQSFLHTGSVFIREQGINKVFSGWFATAIRIGIVTTGYQGLIPIFKQWFETHIKNSSGADLLAGATAGTLAALASHPFDTIKTTQQHAASKGPTPAFYKTAQNIYQDGGLPRFFRGTFWRTSRVATGTIILDQTIKQLRLLLNDDEEPPHSPKKN